MPRKPVALIILDGWGLRQEKSFNAVAQARTPVFDQLQKHWPYTTLAASEEDVGLPSRQCGNSEVGHTNIGAGRIILQDLLRINKAVKDCSFAANRTLSDYISRLKKSGGTSHVIGLLSPGGVHSHMDHIIATVKAMSEAGIKVAVHAILDGRDTLPLSAEMYMQDFEHAIKGLDNVNIATVMGRYYALDRDRRWERISRAFRACVDGEGRHTQNAQAAIQASYDVSVGDEFVWPSIIGDYSGMADGDGLAMMNFRADRVRELLQALLDPNFDDFERRRFIRFTAALGLTEYSLLINRYIETMFPPLTIKDTLGAVMARAGLKQWRIAETEKYAHVTYFFNGGADITFDGEKRILVPSPRVHTYDSVPAMAAIEVTQAFESIVNTADFIVLNFANPDMVGHTGSFPATVEAVETVDRCLGQIINAVLSANGAAFVTADHGNVDQMREIDTGLPHTAHTTSRVPAIFVNAPGQLESGRLCDIAPTLLDFMDIEIPKAMTGKSLLKPTGSKKK